MSTWVQELSTWAYGFVGAAVTGVIFLIRKVTTNERQIVMLEAEIRLRREYDMENYRRLEVSLEEMKRDLKVLVQSK